MYTLVSGTAPDVFALASAVDVFLPSLGWSPYRTVASGISIRDSVYTTTYSGSSYGTLYARILASGTSLYKYTYGYYPLTGSEFSYELGGAGYSNPGAANGCTYWLVGSSKFFWLLAKDSSTGDYHSSYVGYYRSYVPELYDRYPVAVVGQEIATDTFNDGRTIMYTAASGTVGPYQVSTTYLRASGAVPNSRASGASAFAAPVILRTVSELRGELFGIIDSYTNNAVNGTTVSGLSGGRYVTASSGTDSTYYIGPFNG